MDLQKTLPKFDDLPSFHDLAGCAWSVWGPDDQLGTVNILTDSVVAQSAKEEIRSGKAISLNWPIQFADKPVFHRKGPEHTILGNINVAVRDDLLHINTQSGSQWDGMRHFGVLEHGVFYNNTPCASIVPGLNSFPDPQNIDPERIKLGIHNWAKHGICGRGVLLDLVDYFTADGSALPYDPHFTHGITVEQLEACAKKQGVQFRQGDILILRVGFTQKFSTLSQTQKDELSAKPEEFAGVEQSEHVKRFLWDNHFAAVASDQPTFESWPAVGPHLHQTLLGLWGMPIGEMFDLEALSTHCAETGRYSFFFSSWPLNVLGGVGSPPNAAAYF